jgi:hypothetical protein
VDEIKDAGKKRASVTGLNSRSLRKPIYALVGYSASILPDTLARELCGMKHDDRPDLVCIVNLGFIAGNALILNAALSEQSAGYICGVALLQQRDDNGQRIENAYITPEPGARNFIFKDVSYPVTKVSRALFVAEPSRALLIFCEALVRVLAEQDGRPTPAFSYYVTAVARDLFLLE